MHGNSNGHDIRVPTVHAGDEVLRLHLLRRRVRIIHFVTLRHPRCRGQNRTIHLQAPVVNAYGYSIAFDHLLEYLFLAHFETFEIEDVLPMSLQVFARKFQVAYIEIRTYLLQCAVKDSGVDFHKI